MKEIDFRKPEVVLKKELAIDFTIAKKPSKKLELNMELYEASIENMSRVVAIAHTEQKTRLNHGQQAVLDEAEQALSVLEKKTPHYPTKKRGLFKTGASRYNRRQSSSEERPAKQKRSTPPVESAVVLHEDEEEEVGLMQIALNLRDNPAALERLRRLLPPKDYQPIAGRVLYLRAHKEHEEHLQNLAQKTADARTYAQEQWDDARDIIAQSLHKSVTPSEYCLGSLAHILEQIVLAATASRHLAMRFAEERRVKLPIIIEGAPMRQEHEKVLERPKTPLFGLALRLDTDAEKIADKLYALTYK